MLEATGLMVFYENMLALNNISIRCNENQITGVFGANSAGKSTLMYALSGIMLDIKKKGLSFVLKGAGFLRRALYLKTCALAATWQQLPRQRKLSIMFLRFFLH